MEYKFHAVRANVCLILHSTSRLTIVPDMFAEGLYA